MDARTYFNYNKSTFDSERINLFSHLTNSIDHSKDHSKTSKELMINVLKKEFIIVPGVTKDNSDQEKKDEITEMYNAFYEPKEQIDYISCYDDFYNQKEVISIENKTYESLDFFEIDHLGFKPSKDIPIILEDEYIQYIPNTNYSNKQLSYMLNYRKERLIDVINTYDNYVSEHKDKYDILKESYRLSHKKMISNGKLSKWIENFPNFIDAKITAFKRKMHKKNPNRVNASKKTYKVSEMRLQKIITKIENLGYHGFNIQSIRDKMSFLEDDEIINDIIQEISDQYGNDHDLIEIDDNKQLEEHLTFYESKYPNGDPNHE